MPLAPTHFRKGVFETPQKRHPAALLVAQSSHALVACTPTRQHAPIMPNADTLLSLPDELVLRILTLLPLDARACCAVQCRRLRAATQHDLLWRRLDFEGVRRPINGAALAQLCLRAGQRLRCLELAAPACANLDADDVVASLAMLPEPAVQHVMFPACIGVHMVAHQNGAHKPSRLELSVTAEHLAVLPRTLPQLQMVTADLHVTPAEAYLALNTVPTVCAVGMHVAMAMTEDLDERTAQQHALNMLLAELAAHPGSICRLSVCAPPGLTRRHELDAETGRRLRDLVVRNHRLRWLVLRGFHVGAVGGAFLVAGLRSVARRCVVCLEGGSLAPDVAEVVRAQQ